MCNLHTASNPFPLARAESSLDSGLGDDAGGELRKITSAKATGCRGNRVRRHGAEIQVLRHGCKGIDAGSPAQEKGICNHKIQLQRAHDDVRGLLHSKQPSMTCKHSVRITALTGSVHGHSDLTFSRSLTCRLAVGPSGQKYYAREPPTLPGY